MASETPEIQYVINKEKEYMNSKHNYICKYIEIPILEKHICKRKCHKNCPKKRKTKIFYPPILLSQKEKLTIDKPNEIIIPNSEIQVYFNYPLDNPICFTLSARNSDVGISRIELIEFIISAYQKIYEEEEISTKIPSGCLKGTYNRNTTDGIYGIWGHEIGNLFLEGILYFPSELCVRLIMGS